MHDGTTLTFRTPETIPNGLPAHEPRLVRATAESFADYGTIVTDPDNHKVEIVRWPALGWRPIDPNTGDEGGTTEGIFSFWWKGEVLYGRNEAVDDAYLLGWSRDPAKAQHGLVSRMIADPAPLSAFGVGLLVFAPGVTFIAALQVIATARADLEVTTLAVLLVVVINVLLVWLPIMLHLVAPKATEQHLKAFNGWLRANGRTVLTGVLVAAGGIMLFDGIYGLITRSG